MANITREERMSRELASRDTAVRAESWQPAQLLPEPKPRDGIAHRWIRVSLLGQADNMNASVRMREGWEPCLASDYPEMMLYRDKNSQFKDNIEVGGLLLCQTLKETADARQEYYQKAAAEQLQAVDNNYMRENDPRMPMFAERKTKVSFGKG
jgi:hypothetical protein